MRRGGCGGSGEGEGLDIYKKEVKRREEILASWTHSASNAKRSERPLRSGVLFVCDESFRRELVCSLPVLFALQYHPECLHHHRLVQI